MPADAPVNILMVDDQPAKLLSYEAILRDLNENLIKVTSGREALDYLLKNEIALVLLDTDRIRGYERGAVDYISVPVVPDLLRAKVSVFAELYRKTRQLENVNNELRIAEEHLRYLTGRLMQIQDAERRRVARDVHDGLGQYLVGVKMGIDQLCRRLAHDPAYHENLEEISMLLNRARVSIGGI